MLSLLYLYDVTITHFGDVSFITATPWTLCTSVAIQGLVGGIVQSFFAYRVWRVSNLLIWSAIAWIGAATRIALTTAIAYWAKSRKSIIVFSDDFGWAILLSLAISLAVDILNVVALSWYLTGRRTGLETFVSSSIPHIPTLSPILSQDVSYDR